MRWASFEMIDDWEEECRQSIEAHWEEECAAPNIVSGCYPQAWSDLYRSGAPPPSCCLINSMTFRICAAQ
ncbi:hypothetical protein RsS93_43720 [Rhizobium dioscoreae]|uniref:Uncharacterized protein n=1 Tax=Rhizobium dioscoreae TaxID=2653122 RepID=A0ABQ0Z8R9_9HYPH|nr:hypothetical protein RsS93_43720 [Rhizobium dioscoreae]